MRHRLVGGAEATGLRLAGCRSGTALYENVVRILSEVGISIKIARSIAGRIAV